MQFDLVGISLADRQAQALIQVDTEAEAVRLLFITGGAGQSQEYRKTEEEARAYVAGSYPTPFDNAAYSMLHAEMLALADAGLITLSNQAQIDAAAADVADSVIAEANTWIAVAKIIKRKRRGAKLTIGAATTFAQIHAALQITWPAP